MAKRPRCETLLQGVDAEQTNDVLQQILSSLQSMQSTAAGLSKRLQPAVTADSNTSSWWSYAERRHSEYRTEYCADMAGELSKDIENLIRSIAPKNNVTRKSPLTPVNEIFVDVFMPLGRLSLDALELTCRRFNGIVAEHLKDDCLRVFHSVRIQNLEYARVLDSCDTPPVGQVLASPAEKGVYRLAIRADLTEFEKSPSVPLTQKYLYESKSISDLKAVLRTKLSQQCFVDLFEIAGLTEKLPGLAWNAKGALEGVRVDTLVVHDTERGPPDDPYLEIPAADLVPLLDSFSAIRALELQGFNLTSAGNDFLDFCRTKGIVSAKAVNGATVGGDIDVDAVMRFCFGAVSKELEGEERKLQGFAGLDGSEISRIYEKARSTPKQVVKLSFIADGDGDEELFDLLDSRYQFDSAKKRHFVRLDNGVSLYWWLNEAEDRFECRLIPCYVDRFDER